nr:LysR substrate-binding domain-containing protein [Aminobacter sp. AP02]
MLGDDRAVHYGQPVWANATCRGGAGGYPITGRRRGNRRPGRCGKASALHLATRSKAWADWFSLTGVETGSAFQGHRFDQFGMLIQAAVSGMGVALLPRYLVEQELASGVLTVIADAPLATRNAYHFVVPDGKREHPIVAGFYEWVCRQVQGPDSG